MCIRDRGRLDEKLDKERQEAYAAQVKYDAAARELAAVEEDAARCEARLTQLEGCEQVYETALAKKAAALRESGSAAAQELLDAEARIAGLEGQLRDCLLYTSCALMRDVIIPLDGRSGDAASAETENDIEFCKNA